MAKINLLYSGQIQKFSILDYSGWRMTDLPDAQAQLFSTAAETIDKNLSRRVSLGEFFSLLFALSMVGISVWIHISSDSRPYDYQNYLDAVQGDLREYYYGFWILPLIHLFASLPYFVGYFLWAGINVLSIWFAARVFGGNSVLALLSYQMFYVIFYGQISGIVIGMLALAYWGMTHKKWYWAGIGFLIAAAKFQTGLVFGALLWWLIDIPWRQKFKTLLIPLAGVAISFLVYPNWFFIELERMRSQPPNDLGSISLWPWLGVLAPLLFVPLMLIPMDWRKRFLGLIAATALGLPYFQQADLINLMVFPWGWVPLLGNLGFLYYWMSWDALKLLTIVPLVMYLWVVLPAGWQWRKNRGTIA